MTIITENINNLPMAKSVLAISQDAPLVIIPTEGVQIDFCICDYTCEYINEVFADASSSEDFKNDKTSFLTGLSADSATLEILLIGPDGSESIINNNTFGEYFAKGSFTETDNQINYVGFICDWQKVLTIKGAGTYYFKFTESVFGQDFEKTTIKYKLLPYNENMVYRTLRFKFIQNGLLEDGLDYTGLNWNTQVRIKGSLKKLPSELQQDNYFNGDRIVEQIQDKKLKNFQIETGLLNSDIGNLIEDGTLSNRIFITNYKWGDYEMHEDLSINIISIDDFIGNFELNPLGAFVFTAQERKQDTVKRNV